MVQLRSEREPTFFEEFVGLDPRLRRRALFPLFASVAAPLMLSDLPGIIDEVEPDLVVHEPMEFAAAPAATARGIPHATVGFGGFIPDSILREHDALLAQLWESVGLAAPEAGGLYDLLYLHPFPPGLSTPATTRNVHPIRPLGFDGTDAAPPEWVSALGRDRPFVYVTFGTEIAGLAPFRAVIDVIGELHVDAVLTTGQDFDPSTLGATPANLRVERYVPQHLLLQRVSVLISHTGSGAVLGGATFGVPQLSLPIAADQFENADAVSSAGAGLTLEPDEIGADSLLGAMNRLLSEATFALRGRELADEIAAMPHPSDQIALLTALASGKPQPA